MLTAAIASATIKGGGKFVIDLQRALLARATGQKTAGADPATAIREHVRMLKQMGAVVR